MPPWMHDTGRCPRCGNLANYSHGDRFRRCHVCQWTEGRPLLRWLTHRPFRAPGSFGSVLYLAGIVIVVGLIAGVAVGGAEVVDVSSGANEPDDEIDAAEVEAAFVELLNEERQSRGLGTVEQRDELTAMGTEHAENMAEHNYSGHTQTDGTTAADRFIERGLRDQCRMHYPATDSYWAGAENAMMQPVDDSPDYGDIRTSSTLARALFEGWMASPPHKGAMLLGSVESVGLGVEIRNGWAYAALEMCGD